MHSVARCWRLAAKLQAQDQISHVTVNVGGRLAQQLKNTVFTCHLRLDGLAKLARGNAFALASITPANERDATRSAILHDGNGTLQRACIVQFTHVVAAPRPASRLRAM